LASAEQIVKAALVIGTSHAYQRHQDRDAERERIRSELDKLIRGAIQERSIGLLAEEAGSKEQVHARLKADEAKTTEFDVLFAETKAVDEPQETIARLIAAEMLPGCYTDIRPPGAIPLPKEASETDVAKRDEEMFAILEEPLRSATSALVICGKRHQGGLAQRLEQHRFRVEQRTFPENLGADD
jgi:hypothetical protein